MVMRLNFGVPTFWPNTLKFQTSCEVYHIYGMYSDRQASANRVDPDERPL